MMTNKMKS